MVRPYVSGDLPEMRDIWNEVVREGIAFPQEEELDEQEASAFFASQTLSCVCEEGGEMLGLYILHPNNVGRCGHIANASYAVRAASRGRHIGEQLVRDCLERAPGFGFRLLQFNAVVRNNGAARHLYEKLGFTLLGMIPGGFRLPDDTFEDIVLYYHRL